MSKTNNNIKYTFSSLGFLESSGMRIGGAGLGNILFPWARSIIYSRDHNLTRIQTTWRNLKLGPLFRREMDSRLYFNLFTGKDGVDGFKKFYLLNFTDNVKIFSGMEGLFGEFINEYEYIRNELFKIINPYHLYKPNKMNCNSIAVHIRMGDFISDDKEDKLRSGFWNHRIPLKWYVNQIEKIRKICDLPIYIFSDGKESDLIEILKINNCSRVFFGSAISDMIALSNCRIIISSSSTFCMWSSFLGQVPTIYFPGQLKQRLLNKEDILEFELDYNDNIPSIIKRIISDD